VREDGFLILQSIVERSLKYNIFIEISFKSKLRFIEKFEDTIDNVEKPLMGKI
jgi:hypothetical protein